MMHAWMPAPLLQPALFGSVSHLVWRVAVVPGQPPGQQLVQNLCCSTGGGEPAGETEQVSQAETGGRCDKTLPQADVFFGLFASCFHRSPRQS